MDYSVFFYAYSTTAQTLAGAFGFMVAAVLYRIAAYVASEPILNKNFMAIMDSVKDKDEETRRKTQEMFLAPVRSAYLDHDGVQRSLIWSMHWTGGVIIACLILIPATPAIAWFGAWLAWVILVGTVGAAVYTVTTYFPLVRGVAKLRQPDQLPSKFDRT